MYLLILHQQQPLFLFFTNSLTITQAHKTFLVWAEFFGQRITQHCVKPIKKKQEGICIVQSCCYSSTSHLAYFFCCPSPGTALSVMIKIKFSCFHMETRSSNLVPFAYTTHVNEWNILWQTKLMRKRIVVQYDWTEVTTM